MMWVKSLCEISPVHFPPASSINRWTCTRVGSNREVLLLTRARWGDEHVSFVLC